MGKRPVVAGVSQETDVASPPTPTESKRIARRFPAAVATAGDVDRIAERWLLPDVFGLLEQLGAVDVPGE